SNALPRPPPRPPLGDETQNWARRCHRRRPPARRRDSCAAEDESLQPFANLLHRRRSFTIVRLSITLLASLISRAQSGHEFFGDVALQTFDVIEGGLTGSIGFDLHEFTPASLGHRHSISRVSKRLTPRETACFRARYWTDFTLEKIFQRDLQNARIPRRAGAPERPRRASRAGRRSRCDRAEPLGKVEVRMVEEIEELRTKVKLAVSRFRISKLDRP